MGRIKRIKFGYSEAIDFGWIYAVSKYLLFSCAALTIYLNISKSYAFTILACLSITLDLYALFCVAGFVKTIKIAKRAPLYVTLVALVIIVTLYPISWDDLSYGLTIPKLFLAHNSFEPIWEYGIFTYFPLIEYARTAISFGFGTDFQAIYRLECLALYLTSFVYVLKICRLGLVNKAKDDVFNVLITLLTLTTVAAFNVFAFVKPESFTTFMFLLSTYCLMRRQIIKGMLCLAIAIPFKYTTIITGFSLLLVLLKEFKKRIDFINPLRVFVLTLVVFTAVLWMKNNYDYTGDPLYPFFMNFFPYSADGVMDQHEYRKVIGYLMGQEDVAFRNIHSYKFFKSIITQLGFVTFVVPVGYFLIGFSRFKFETQKNLRTVALIFLGVLVVFLAIFFAEFRYVYAIIIVIVLTSLLIIQMSIPCKHKLKLCYLLCAMIFFQMVFVCARNYKNSIFDLSRYPLPVHLSMEQTEELKCINSYPTISERVASFDQTFLFWGSQFFFLHELNEFVGLLPTSKQLKYAFDKFNVRFILLPTEYLNHSFLDSIKLGGLPRPMLSHVMNLIQGAYDLEIMPRAECQSFNLYQLVPHSK